MRILIVLFFSVISAHAVDALIDGQYRDFSFGDALARAVAGDQAFAQALGKSVEIPRLTYLEITQMRQGNTTIDAAIERAELGS